MRPPLFLAVGNAFVAGLWFAAAVVGDPRAWPACVAFALMAAVWTCFAAVEAARLGRENTAFRAAAARRLARAIEDEGPPRLFVDDGYFDREKRTTP